MGVSRPYEVTARDSSGAIREEKEFRDLDDVAKFVEFHRDRGNAVSVWPLSDGKARRYLDARLALCRERHRGLL